MELGVNHDVDVIIVGAGPTGLMLARELCLAGVRPLILERQPWLRDTAKANGLGGQILELLRFRGLLEQFEDASPGPTHPAPIFPFGNVHLDFSWLTDPPMWGLSLPQPRLEFLLAARAQELGAEIRRDHDVVDVRQDDTTVTVHVDGPTGSTRLVARYLVGCDGPRSRVREATGIAFPGTTYPEVNRLGQVTLRDGVTRLDGGDLAVEGLGVEGLGVEGLGVVRAGFTRTDRGVFGFGPLTDEVMLVSTTEDGSPADDDEPMTMAELQDSIRRILGGDIPFAHATRLSRYRFQARHADRYRNGRVFLAGDAAHQFPATGIGLNVGMLDAVNLAWKLAADVQRWAPAGLLDSYHAERHLVAARGLLQTQAQVALRRGNDAAADALREVILELASDEQALRRLGRLLAGTDVRYPLPNPNDHPLVGRFAPDLPLRDAAGGTSVAQFSHTARPLLLDLADRADVRDTARDWRHRVDYRTATTDQRPADALLIRPDAHVAWAADVGEPTASVVPALRDALYRWFGAPRR